MSKSSGFFIRKPIDVWKCDHCEYTHPDKCIVAAHEKTHEGHCKDCGTHNVRPHGTQCADCRLKEWKDE